ncbi:MAG: DUF5722 domain-containing protein [Verrucomicrobiaceae bacterium]
MRIVICFCVLLASVFSVVGESRYTEDYPEAGSKKGLQVELVGDALSLGVKHAALNFNLSQLVDPKGEAGNPSTTLGGKEYHFRQGYLAQMDRKIKALSEPGVLVNLIVLTYQSHDAEVNRLMLHPKAVEAPPNRLCNFNTVTPEGRAWFQAAMNFVAERWARPDRKFGRVVGYVIGNEVNSHWWWSNMGRVTMEEYTRDYERTMRLAYQAVRRESSWARVYVSMEHHWTKRFAAGDEMQAFPGRDFLGLFAKLVREKGEFPWHVAFHPYPENLRNPRFWEDKTATDGPDTHRITFKNPDVLVDYLKRPEMTYRGTPRRIILSEQGFDTPKGPQGEVVQAAAYCLAYKTVESMEGIDSFILHRHVDHKQEGGLRLGLRRWDAAKTPKKIYEVFKLADTPEWEEAFRFALPIVGREDWEMGK